MAVVFKSVLWVSSCLWWMSKEPVGLNSVYKPNYSFSAFPTCISHKNKSAILKPARTWSWSRPGLLLALPLYPQLSTFSALFGQLSLVISLPIFWNFVGIAYYLHFSTPLSSSSYSDKSFNLCVVPEEGPLNLPWVHSHLLSTYHGREMELAVRWPGYETYFFVSMATNMQCHHHNKALSRTVWCSC